MPPSPAAAVARLANDFLKWKFGLFLHFNVATYNAREYANGYEDPEASRRTSWTATSGPMPP